MLLAFAIALRDCWALVAGKPASRLAGNVIIHFANPFLPRFSIAAGGLV